MNNEDRPDITAFNINSGVNFDLDIAIDHMTLQKLEMNAGSPIGTLNTDNPDAVTWVESDDEGKSSALAV